MAEVDSLEIKLGVDATKASQAIDKIIKKIDSLANSLKSVNASAMSSAAKSLSQNLSNINGKGFSELNKSAKEAQKTVNQISATAKKGIKSKISFDASEYQAKIKELSSKFSEAGKRFKIDGNLSELEKQADKLSSKLENLVQKEDKIVSVGKTSPESSIFQNLQYDISETVNKLDVLASKIGELRKNAKDLSGINIKRWSEQTGEAMAQQPKVSIVPVSSMGYNKEAIEAIEKIASGADKVKVKTGSLGNKVDELKEKLKELRAQGLSFGDAKFDETYKQLNKANEDLKKYKSNLEQAGTSGGTFAERMKNALSGINSSSSRTGNAMRTLSLSVKNAMVKIKGSSVGIKGLSKNIGLLYAKIYALMRIGKGLFKSIGSAQDYIEEFNYFSVALDKIGKDSASQFREAGYNSAEEYAKSFRGRFAKLQKQMTGYEVDYNTGNAISKMTHNLGLDLSEVMSFNAAIAQITNSAGMLGETSIMTSKALSMLSADWSSLANEDLSTVMRNMQSALVGQSRAVYKYGIDITNAGLAQTAMNHGLDVSINKLSQQSKMQLRALTILEQSKVAYGDLARTINQPMNQLRMLQAGFKKISMTIGSLFIPILEKLYPYLNAMVMVLQEFVQWIAKISGIKLGDISGGISAPDYSDMVDDTDSAADNMDKVAKKTKKASDNLQGFDIINKLTKDESDKDEKDKGVKNIDLSKDLAAALKDYESIWDKAFKDNTNKAVQLAKKIKKALLDAWRTGDFSKLGAKLAEWINKGLAKIPWNKIKATIKKIAKSIATFLNGFIKGINWTLVGKTIAEGLNTAIDGSYEFWTTFDWLAFGESLAEGVRSFIDAFKAKKYGKLLGAKLRGVIQFAFGLLTNLPYKKIGKKFGDAINGFFEDMGKVRKNTGLTGWQELGQTISRSITGILDTINTALSTVKWEEVGKAIADFLVNIDWWGIFEKLMNVLANTLVSVVKTAFSAIAENPAGMIKALTGAFALIFTVKKLLGGFGLLKNVFKTLFSTKISEGLKSTKISEDSISGLSSKIKNIGSNGKIKKSCSNIGKILGKLVVIDFAASIIKGVGDSIQKAVSKNPDNTPNNAANSIEDVFNNYGKVFSGLGGIINSLLSGDMEGAAKSLKELGKGLTPEIKTSSKQDITDKSIDKTIKETGKYSDALDNLKSKLKGMDVGLDGMQYGISKASTALKNGTITTKELSKILKSPTIFKNVDELLKEIGVNGVRNTSRYSKAQDNLQKKMEKLNVSTESQGDIFLALNDALDKGKISWKQYKELTNGNYKSIKDLNTAIAKLNPKEVSVEAKVEGEQKVKDTKTEIDGINDKTVTVKANADTGKAEREINKLTKEKTVKVQAKADVENATKITKQISDAIKINPKIKNVSFSEKAKSTLSNALNVDLKVRTILISKKIKDAGLTGANIGLSALNALQKDGAVKYYATGGFPEDGWFRANHGEVMGKFDNGQSVVANNKQITDGIAQAVGPAVYAAVKAAMNENGGDGEQIVINLDGKTIAKSTINNVRSMTKQTGRNPILVNV